MVSYTLGVWDILRSENLDKLDRTIQLTREENDSIEFGVGIYDENICEELGVDKPIKSLEDRMEIMKQIIGVDFVFPVKSLDKDVIKKNVVNAYEAYKKEKEQGKKPKQYKLGYAPGTYDLFHAGHLENLMIASENCEKLIVGVKADELVYQHKGKMPVLRDKERMEILRHFKFVDGIYKYYTRDVKNAKMWIESKYGTNLEVVFFGSDLQEDFKDMSDDITVIFTPRAKEKMKERSTTAYRKKILNLSTKESSKHVQYTGKVLETFKKVTSIMDPNEKKGEDGR